MKKLICFSLFCLLLCSCNKRPKVELENPDKLSAILVKIESREPVFGKLCTVYVNDEVFAEGYYHGEMPTFNVEVGTYVLQAEIEKVRTSTVEVIVDADTEDEVEVILEWSP